MDIFSPTIIDNAIITGSNNASLLQVSSPSATSAFFISGSGNIGIGTTLPLSTLSVAGGNININDGYSIGGNALGSYVPFLRYNNTGAGVPSSSFGHTTAYITSLGGGVFGTNDLIFYAGGLTQTEIVRIVGSTGFVGIGESSPSAKLEIKGSGATSTTTALRVENSSAAARLTILDDGTSAFNTSHLYVSSSGNVGIGTTTPQRELDVNGAIRVNTIHRGGGSSTLNILTDNSSAARINIGGALIGTLYDTNPNTNEIRTTNNQNLSINARGSGSLFLQTTDTTRLTITGSNVGIGTTTPTNTLQVVGGITATSITASIISASSGITGSLFGTSSWAQSASNAINAQTASFLPVGTYQITSSWAQSASNAINAQTASFLPVGTYQITSSWAVSASNSINARTSSNIFPAITNNTSSYVLTATGNGTINGNSNLTFDGNDLILSNGNIKLPVNGYIFGGDTQILNGNHFLLPANPPALPNDVLAGTSSLFARNTQIQIRSISEPDVVGGYESGSIFFKTPSGSGMTYTNEGRLGIGISNPTNTLQIQGNVSASSYTGSLFGTSSWATNALTASNITPSITNNTDNRVLTATGGGTINGESNLTFDGSVLTVTGRANISTSITSSTATVGFGLTSALNAGQTTIRGSGVDTVGALTIQNSGGTAVFTVLNGGTTGVGENNPSARLHVKGSGATSATTALRVENSSAAASLTILDDGTSAFNTSHLYVSSSGNVGIGLTSPLARLHISGANALRMQNTGFDTFEWFFNAGTGIGFRNVTDGTTPFFVGGTDDIGIGTTNTSARLHVSGASNSNLLRVGSPAQANILFITGSGNIGVGTTTPGVTLDVVGQIRASSTMFNSTTQTNTIQLSSATNLQFLSASVETARYDNTGWGFFNTTPTARVHISGANTDNLFRISSPSATNALFVSGSGNVGIGTSAPNAKLHISSSGGYQLRVAASASFSSSLMVSGSFGYVGIGVESPQSLLHVNDRPEFNNVTGNVAAAFAGNYQNITTFYNNNNQDNTVLGDPAAWMSIKCDGTEYLIPLYTS